MLTDKYNHINNVSRAIFIMLVLQGVSIIVLGVLIIIFPDILILLVASLCFWIGIITLSAAWRVHKFNKELKRILNNI